VSSHGKKEGGGKNENPVLMKKNSLLLSQGKIRRGSQPNWKREEKFSLVIPRKGEFISDDLERRKKKHRRTWLVLLMEGRKEEGRDLSHIILCLGREELFLPFFLRRRRTEPLSLPRGKQSGKERGGERDRRGVVCLYSLPAKKFTFYNQGKFLSVKRGKKRLARSGRRGV